MQLKRNSKSNLKKVWKTSVHQARFEQYDYSLASQSFKTLRDHWHVVSQWEATVWSTCNNIMFFPYPERNYQRSGLLTDFLFCHSLAPLFEELPPPPQKLSVFLDIYMPLAPYLLALSLITFSHKSELDSGTLWKSFFHFLIRSKYGFSFLISSI